MEAFPATVLATPDPVLATAIPPQLQHTLGASCTVVEEGAALAQTLASAPPALLVLDSRLPLPQALDAYLAQLRAEHPLMGLVVLGGAVQEDTPLSACCPLPVSPAQLLQHIERLAYVRRLRAGEQTLALTAGAVFHPAQAHIRLADGTHLALTDKETALLRCLYHHRHNWLPRNRLLEEVWGYQDGITTHTLETHIYRLRSKLRAVSAAQELILNREGSYRLAL